MVWCMECGKQLSRIQSHHLRSKRCTGNVKDFKEYQEKYPDAELIDPELVKRTTLTKHKFIEKYGELEGKSRWDSYREKQAVSNTFEYKEKHHGWTKEQFDRFNSSRAVTIDNLVAKHGEHEGMLRWQRYCDRQAYTCSIEYFIVTYGEEEGRKRWETWDQSREIQGRINLEKSWNCTISIIEKTFFDKIIPILELNPTNRNRWYYCNNDWPARERRRNVDYLDHSNKIAIEFFGDYYHMNPVIYTADDWNPTCKKTASDRWSYDAETRRSLEADGYRLYIVWEGDWRHRPRHIIDEISKWMININ